MSWACCLCDKDHAATAPASPRGEFVPQRFWSEAESPALEETSEDKDSEVASAEPSPGSVEPLSRCLTDVKLLRGTSLAQILRGFGRELRSSKLSSDEAEILYNQSYPVEHLDYFVSHCWSDGRAGKLFALWIHSNLPSAMLISSVFSATLTLLCRLRLLPVVQLPELGFEFFPWALLMGYSSFFLILASWHHMRSVRRKTYFLDKFCVHQTDLQLKHAGVASFAAFVSMSNCLLLLWSPTYFKRLWCMLEISALVKSTLTSPKAQSAEALPLQFIPLQLAKLSLGIWLTCYLVLVAVQINTIFNKPVPDTYFIAASCICAAYLQIASFRQYARDRTFLAQQLRSFAVQSAVCSDEQDRQLIEATILNWFDTHDLEVCNRQIRSMVSDKVLASLGPAQHYPTKLLLPVLLLHFCNNADYASGSWFDTDTFWRALGPVLGFGIWMMLMVPLCFRLSHCFARKCSNRCCDVLVNMLLAVVVTLGWLGGWYVNYFFVGFLLVPPWLAVLLVLLECLLFLWLQRASFGCAFRHRSST